MSNTSKTIPAVFAELRRMLGNAASTVDTLNFAAVIVKFFDLKTAPEKAYEPGKEGDLDAGWQLFEELPVDIAMRDGGWKILEYEYGCVRADSMEFGEIFISELRASYIEPYGPAPGDRVQAESLDWLNVRLRPKQVAIEHLKELIFKDSEIDNDE